MNVSRCGPLLAVGIVVALNAEAWAQNRAGGDEQAIRQSAAAFAEAFNKHDAKAIAQGWTADGEYVDEASQRIEGRDAIEKAYAAFFKQHPEATLRIEPESVRFPTSNVAIEDGRIDVKSAPNGSSSSARYTAIHVKQSNGRWLVASVRDLPVGLSSSEGVQALDWLVGDWIAEEGGKRAEVTCRWNPAKTFLERRSQVTNDGKIEATSTEIIAWDPVMQQMRSWTFASDGGRAEGVWTASGDGWVVATEGVMADGTPTSSVDAWAPLLGNAIGWRSMERSAGGTPLKAAGHVVLKNRKK